MRRRRRRWPPPPRRSREARCPGRRRPGVPLYARFVADAITPRRSRRVRARVPRAARRARPRVEARADARADTQRGGRRARRGGHCASLEPESPDLPLARPWRSPPQRRRAHRRLGAADVSPDVVATEGAQLRALARDDGDCAASELRLARWRRFALWPAARRWTRWRARAWLRCAARGDRLRDIDGDVDDGVAGRRRRRRLGRRRRRRFGRRRRRR